MNSGVLNVVLHVVQTKEIADELRKIITLPNVTIAFYGQALCGVHYHGKRPSVIICDYDNRIKFGWERDGRDWESVVLRPAAHRDVIYVRNT